MSETPSATAILAPIWRRKWLILLVGVIVAGATYLYYRREPTVFRSETKLYLSGGTEETIAGEKATAGKSLTTIEEAQPQIINSVIVESVHRALKHQSDHIAKVAAKGKAKAKSAEKPQFVTITAEARTPKASALLANTVAQTYIKRAHDQYERAILDALIIAKRQLRRLETPTLAGNGKGGIASTNVLRETQLSGHINQLEAQMSAQHAEQLNLARPARAVLVEPLPKKNAEFGFVIGIVLASIGAYMLARADRRLRTLADVEAVFRAPLLAALPIVRQPIVHTQGYARPSRFMLEPLRLLHTTLLIAGATPSQNGSGNGTVVKKSDAPRSILFVSADDGDGRSTVVAALALVQREAGERAAIVEADLRRPTQARILGLPGHSGLIDVLTGALALEEALQTVPAPEPETLAGIPRGGAEAGTALASRDTGAVLALPSQAPLAVNPPALLASKAMHETLEGVEALSDHVLIDAPSPLEFSDVMPLLPAADAIVLVVRVGHTRERSAERLRQLLAQTPSAPVLGVVANGVATRDIQRYGMSAGPARGGWRGRLTGR